MHLKIDPQIHWEIRIFFGQKRVFQQPVSTNSPTFAPRIRIIFTDEGAKRLSEVTRQNIGKRLAIIIEGQIYSAPKIQPAITSGTAEIAGSFNAQEARDFVASINKTLQK
jgi:preprotein translocase subunit SecD